MKKFTAFEFQKGNFEDKYGIYDKSKNEFMNIVEDSPMLAKARLCLITGEKKHMKKQYEIKIIPKDLIKSIEENIVPTSNKHFGIWNDMKREYQFGIIEDSKELATARLFYKIGEHARKCRFYPKEIPDALLPTIKQKRKRK